MPKVPDSSGLVVNSGISPMIRSSHLGLRVTSASWTFPRGCAPSATSTWPRCANTAAGTSTTASRRTCLAPASGPGSPGWLRPGPTGERAADAYDEAQLTAAEDQKQVVYATLELHRRNPLLHLGELDLAGYDRDYAPQAERDAARAEHLAAWPRVADAAVESLDQVSAPVAQALVGSRTRARRGAARRASR